jgi:ElaA protein
MQFKLKKFNELTNEELYALLKLRCDVFIVEQNCPYPDLDEKDKTALHLLGYDGKDLAAYARLLPPGLSYKEAAIGRVVVSSDHRKKDFGKELMKEANTCTLKEFGVNEIVISAQLYLLKFYTDLGYKAEGEQYPEDDIPHIKMRYKL